MIEEIEEFGAQLQVESLGKISVLQQRHVYVLIARPIKSIAAGITKRAQRRKSEGAGVEPTVGRRIGQNGVSHHVGSIVRSKAENRTACAAVINVGQEGRSERPP